MKKQQIVALNRAWNNKIGRMVRIALSFGILANLCLSGFASKVDDAAPNEAINYANTLQPVYGGYQGQGQQQQYTLGAQYYQAAPAGQNPQQQYPPVQQYYSPNKYGQTLTPPVGQNPQQQYPPVQQYYQPSQSRQTLMTPVGQNPQQQYPPVPQYYQPSQSGQTSTTPVGQNLQQQYPPIPQYYQPSQLGQTSTTPVGQNPQQYPPAPQHYQPYPPTRTDAPDPRYQSLPATQDTPSFQRPIINETNPPMQLRTLKPSSTKNKHRHKNSKRRKEIQEWREIRESIHIQEICEGLFGDLWDVYMDLANGTQYSPDIQEINALYCCKKIKELFKAVDKNIEEAIKEKYGEDAYKQHAAPIVHFMKGTSSKARLEIRDYIKKEHFDEEESEEESSEESSEEVLWPCMYEKPQKSRYSDNEAKSSLKLALSMLENSILGCSAKLGEGQYAVKSIWQKSTFPRGRHFGNPALDSRLNALEEVEYLKDNLSFVLNYIVYGVKLGSFKNDLLEDTLIECLSQNVGSINGLFVKLMTMIARSTVKKAIPYETRTPREPLKPTEKAQTPGKTWFITYMVNTIEDCLINFYKIRKVNYPGYEDFDDIFDVREEDAQNRINAARFLKKFISFNKKIIGEGAVSKLPNIEHLSAFIKFALYGSITDRRGVDVLLTAHYDEAQKMLDDTEGLLQETLRDPYEDQIIQAPVAPCVLEKLQSMQPDPIIQTTDSNSEDGHTIPEKKEMRESVGSEDEASSHTTEDKSKSEVFIDNSGEWEGSDTTPPAVKFVGSEDEASSHTTEDKSKSEVFIDNSGEWEGSDTTPPAVKFVGSEDEWQGVLSEEENLVEPSTTQTETNENKVLLAAIESDDTLRIVFSVIAQKIGDDISDAINDMLGDDAEKTGGDADKKLQSAIQKKLGEYLTVNECSNLCKWLLCEIWNEHTTLGKWDPRIVEELKKGLQNIKPLEDELITQEMFNNLKRSEKIQNVIDVILGEDDMLKKIAQFFSSTYTRGGSWDIKPEAVATNQAPHSDDSSTSFPPLWNEGSAMITPSSAPRVPDEGDLRMGQHVPTSNTWNSTRVKSFFTEQKTEKKVSQKESKVPVGGRRKEPAPNDTSLVTHKDGVTQVNLGRANYYNHNKAHKGPDSYTVPGRGRGWFRNMNKDDRVQKQDSGRRYNRNNEVDSEGWTVVRKSKK